MRSAADRRRAELASIHIGKAELGLDDETYRALLWTVGRAHSSKDLDSHGRRAVIEHMRARGFEKKNKTGSYPGRPHNIGGNPQLKKIEALLADAKRPWSYVDSMAQRMYHVDRVTFCSPDQLQGLIAALVYDQQRRTKSKETTT